MYATRLVKKEASLSGSEVECLGGTRNGPPIFQLDLRNHCLLCLEEELPSKIYEVTRMNPENITSFQPIIHYLTRTDPSGDKSAEECRQKGVPVVENVPPLCSKCYEVCGELYRLHMDLLEIQVKIQRTTDTLRNSVENTRRPGVDGKGRSRVVRFGKKFDRSKMPPQQIQATKKFVTTFHKQIIDTGQGDNRVIFPSHPHPPREPNVPIRPQPTPVPVPTQPLIFPRIPALIHVASSSSSSITSRVGVPLRPICPSIFKPAPSLVNHVQQERQQRQPNVPHAKKSKTNMTSAQNTLSLQPKPTSFSTNNNMVILPDTNVDRFEVEGEDDFREFEEDNGSDDDNGKPDISVDSSNLEETTCYYG